MGYEKIISQKGGQMRNSKIDRRLVGNYDKQDKQFYFIIQKWNGDRYENVSTFETERCEVNGIKEQYQNEVLDAEINDGGHTFGTYKTGYVDAPDLSEVPTGDGGLPASPYGPNPMSPGEGSANPADMPEAPGGWADSQLSNPPFSGVGSQLSPKVASEKISGTTLGAYVLGKSPASDE